MQHPTLKGIIYSLWFKLSMAFTLIGLLSVTGLSTLFFVLNDAVNFQQYVTADTLTEIIRSEQLLFSQALEDPDDERWQAKIEEEVKSKILRMTRVGDLNFYSIEMGSNPELHYVVSDASGKRIFQYSDPPSTLVKSDLPRPDDFDVPFGLDSNIANLPGSIQIQQTIFDSDGHEMGQVQLRLLATYHPWMVIRKFILAYFKDWPSSLSSFVFIGLMCGAAANLFVTGRLARVNTITAIWSTGDLKPRIPLNRAGYDVLAKHSRILNGLADEMNSLVALRQRSAIIDERNRVARDVHDTVKQKLFALKLQLSSLKKLDCPAEAISHIDESLGITREAQQDIVNILTQLAPMSANEKNFFARLSALGDQMKRRYGITVIWERKEDVAFDHDEENTLFRITQEALNNAVRHGQATKFFMDAYREDGINHWTMVDNGSGMAKARDASQRNDRGLGLPFMRERVNRELSGGSISVGNGENGGVKVEIRWTAK